MTDDLFMNRLAAFLHERCRSQAVLAHLRNHDATLRLWRRHYAPVRHCSEYAVAIRLTHALACEALSKKAPAGPDSPAADPDGLYRMKSDLAAWGVVRFSEFDL